MSLIPRFECLSCGGQYDEQMPDGTTYAHICGPLPADKHGVAGEREDKRDETPNPKTGGIRAEGRGSRCLTNKTLSESRWITAMRADWRKRNPQEKEHDDA